MALKHVVYRALDHRPGRPLIGIMANLRAKAAGEQARFIYDRACGLWSKRTPAGVMPLPERLQGMSIEECQAFTHDVFLRDYTVKPGDVVLDIGAGIGTETLPFSRWVEASGKVIVVEAHPATFETLKRACQLNDVRNVELLHAAIMDSDTPVMISDLPTEVSYENRIGSEGIVVPALTLPDLVRRYNLDRIDFLKMNIEGAELPALQGASEVLPLIRNAAIGCHDFLAEETGDDQYRTKDAVNTLLVDAGFTVRRRDDDPRPWARDYLFASR
ncbi:FkbM family methyltransferase [Mycobacterium neglectum]|uniref:FkbM family methyltransferase n=1 Tax=Mycobacterium neglectum TaxID=242737 RepID=UPI00159B8D80|nr:FkbM family methyltransferase [Mycobacterium neglectum]